jgi:transcriptional regulator of heat shock response
MISSRKEKLLQLIIENYLSTAEPVGSKFLAESTDLQVSGATVRNEMRELEEHGFLTHPHTSAGRIPTEAGYKYYIENIMKPISPNKKIKESIDSVIKENIEKDKKLKNIAKHISEHINNAVIVAFNQDNIYYTGISNLFSHSEFRNYAHTVSMSSVFDQCEEKIDDLYNLVESEKHKVLLGTENPLGSSCGAVLSKINDKELFILLGPTRMDYGRSAGVLNYIQKIFK